MKTSTKELLLLHLLRIGLIAVRNFSASSNRNDQQQVMLEEWAELCHMVPPLLMSDCDERAVKYFIEVQGRTFLRDYPSKDDVNFIQVAEILDELEAMNS
ncbi:hypothetical protein [Prosthecobacter sp.]|uniref:hypothetical protein n=1 Tax=Prosthecobacter sp. TaxID=1965333 RepID=UPI003784FC78